MRNGIGWAVWVVLIACAWARGVVFEVELGEGMVEGMVSGRVVVYLVGEGSSIGAGVAPSEGPFMKDVQPLFGRDVKGLGAGQVVRVDDSAEGYPAAASKLAAGKYRAQAVFDRARESGFWQREAGNLTSNVVKFESPKDGVVKLKLANVVKPREVPTREGVEIIEVRSELLSKFRGREVILRAGVVRPVGYDPTRKYAAVYEIPSFHKDHLAAFTKAEAIASLPEDSPERELYRNVFWIDPDPDGPNGHTLFCDSEVNGPCGEAFVKELIPAIEKRFSIVSEGKARLVRGHSSGGWSAVWLATQYPEVFGGGCWAYSPDPVDFRRLECVDVYGQESAYVDAAGKDVPSFRLGEDVRCTVRIENALEQVVGPDNSSAGQWDSWQAAWGRRNGRGNPRELFDPKTGKIDREEAAFYRRHDITGMLMREPAKYGPVFRKNIRVLSGAWDEFYLNKAAEFLSATLEGVKGGKGEAHWGYVKVLPDEGHGTVLRSAEARAFEADALERLREAGYVVGK